MALTQIALIEVKTDEIRSKVNSSDSSLLIFFAFKFSFFRKQPSRDVLGGGFSGGMQQICRGACWGPISVKFKSNFIKIALRYGCSPVGLLCIFGPPFPGNLLFYFVINPKGEIRIQLDVSLWSLER